MAFVSARSLVRYSIVVTCLVLTASVTDYAEANARFAQGSGSQLASGRRLQQDNDENNGRCSYDDLRAGRCPGQPRSHTFYWDLLFQSPFGSRLPAAPAPAKPCTPQNSACTTAQECCPLACNSIGGNDTACITTCSNGICAPGCFAGDTKVVIKESTTPIRIRDLQTGQHVQCVDSGDDLTSPGAIKWCPVMNWMHATEEVVSMQQIAFTRYNGEPGNVTITFNHFMMRLTSPGVTAGASALRLDAFGPFEVVAAAKLNVGDRIVLLKDPADASAGYYVAEITALQMVNGNGMYLPMIEMPYIIADGAVVPREIDWEMPVVAPPTISGPENIAISYLASCVWMKALQPTGLPGTNGSWPDPSGANTTSPIFPRLWEFDALVRRKVAQGLALDFMAVQQWFMPRFNAWKDNSSAAVTVDEVMQALEHMWVPQPEADAVQVEQPSLSTPHSIPGACTAVAVTSPSTAVVDATCAGAMSEPFYV